MSENQIPGSQTPDDVERMKRLVRERRKSKAAVKNQKNEKKYAARQAKRINKR